MMNVHVQGNVVLIVLKVTCTNTCRYKCRTSCLPWWYYIWKVITYVDFRSVYNMFYYTVIVKIT